jgi:hypothetical protein
MIACYSQPPPPSKKENKDQQGKATVIERSPRHNPVTPIWHLEGIEKTQGGKRRRICKMIRAKRTIQHLL